MCAQQKFTRLLDAWHCCCSCCSFHTIIAKCERYVYRTKMCSRVERRSLRRGIARARASKKRILSRVPRPGRDSDETGRQTVRRFFAESRTLCWQKLCRRPAERRTRQRRQRMDNLLRIVHTISFSHCAILCGIAFACVCVIVANAPPPSNDNTMDIIMCVSVCVSQLRTSLRPRSACRKRVSWKKDEKQKKQRKRIRQNHRRRHRHHHHGRC